MTRTANQSTFPLSLIGLMAARLLAPMVSFAIIILVARLWGKTLLGQYTTIWAWLAICQYFSQFGLPDFVAKEIGRAPRDAALCLTHGMFFILLNASLAVVLLSLGAAFSAYPAGMKSSLILAAFSTPAAGCIAMCQAVCIAMRRLSYIVIPILVDNLIFLSMAAAVVFSGHYLILLMAALVTARMVAAFLNLYLVNRRVLPFARSLNWGFGRNILAGAAVFGITSVAGLAFLRLDIIVLSRFCDMASVGLYSAASKLIEICLVLPITFYFVHLPVAAQYFHQSPRPAPRNLEAAATDLFFLAVAILVGGMIFAEPVISRLYGPAYAASAGILRILLVVLAVMSAETFLSMSCQAGGLHKAAMYIALLRLVVGVVCQVIFVRQWGLAGAAWAVLTAMLTSFTLTFMVVRRYLVSFNWFAMLKKPALTGIVALTVVLPLAAHLNPLVAIGVYVVIYGSMFALLQGWWGASWRKPLAWLSSQPPAE